MWTGVETVVTTWLTEFGNKTRLEMTIRHASPEARHDALESAIAGRMEAACVRFDNIFQDA